MKICRVTEPIQAQEADLSASSFDTVNLAQTVFRDVNMSGVVIDNVKLEGATLRNVNLSRLKITDANLSHASISESCTHGLTIDGIAVEDLMAAYKAAQQNS